MVNSYLDSKASDDFDKAKKRASISSIINSFTPYSKELLSLQNVKEIIKPKGETYKGMEVVPIEKIVGSEGRYQDFSKQFLPKYEYLRNRWERIDKAHLSDVILPPIKLYQIGDVYFVRDGNHRVSVAKAQGVENIDAEVVELTSEIQITSDTTLPQLTEKVIQYERDMVFEQTPLHDIFSDDEFVFTEPGRYHEMLNHILEHKYYINQNLEYEITLEQAIRSWYENLYKPISTIIENENYLLRFPGRTKSDLYIWIIKHWHTLKEEYGEDFSLKQAAADYSQQFGKNLWDQFKKMLAEWYRYIFKR